MRRGFGATTAAMKRDEARHPLSTLSQPLPCGHYAPEGDCREPKRRSALRRSERRLNREGLGCYHRHRGIAARQFHYI